MRRTKKKHQLFSDVASWYGINPYELEKDQLIGLWRNLGRVQAQKVVVLRGLAGVDSDRVYDLMLAAYDNEEIAQNAQMEALEAEMQRRQNEANARGGNETVVHR